MVRYRLDACFFLDLKFNPGYFLRISDRVILADITNESIACLWNRFNKTRFVRIVPQGSAQLLNHLDEHVVRNGGVRPHACEKLILCHQPSATSKKINKYLESLLT